MKTPLRLLAVAVLAAAASACMTIGRDFPTDKIADIKIGKTTQADLTAQYGHPYRTGIEDGDTTWTFLQYKLNLFSGEKTRDLYVRFNADGTVKSYAFNTNE